MIALESKIEGEEISFSDAQKQLSELGFTLGGNWDYEHGSFDYALDEEDKVWLRLPFDVAVGKLDSEREGQEDTVLRFGVPFVLKHLYNEGIDKSSDFMTYRGFVDQFQAPVDADAQVEDIWIDKAKGPLAEAEKRLLAHSAV